MRKKTQFIFPVVLLLLLAIILLLKLSISLHRQFDPDEFAYLHWSWLIIKGYIPYRDFFFYGTPVFLWPLSVLFLLPHGPLTALGARLMMFFIYTLLLILTYFIAKRLTQKTNTSLFAVLLLAAFPMTFDKTIEIRPDTLMIVLFLGSFLLFVRKKILASGIICGVNALLFLKIVVLLPSFLPLFFIRKKEIKITWMQFFIGACIPVILFFLYLLSNRIVFGAWNAVINISRLANNEKWGFPPLTGLTPFKLVYLTRGGMTYPWIVNTIILLLSVPGIPILFFKTKKTPSIFLWAILFLFESIALFLLFPRPHMQYFIPVTVITAILAALTVTTCTQWLEDRMHIPSFGSIGLMLASLPFVISFFLQTTDRIGYGNMNDEQLQVLTDVIRVIRPEETVYDEVGSYIFRPDGYFICCHHYEQFVDKLDPHLWSLKNNLIQSKTKFIVLDQKGFVFWTPKTDDLQFIITHYLPSAYKKIYTLGSQFQCRQGSCIQLNVHDKPVSLLPIATLTSPPATFDVVIEEQYKIRVQPSNQRITINNNSYKNNQTVVFVPGIYRFSAPSGVTSFSVQLDR